MGANKQHGEQNKLLRNIMLSFGYRHDKIKLNIKRIDHVPNAQIARLVYYVSLNFLTIY